ncbi:hypothetical protein [Brevundimonas denitrificans]|uniref:hypothetical protein n=1 Tax=Brevundimonas denitrificans TaxID=1443434 RepID=UPI00223B2BED|nr:hypothetical protein [Brevundimonas denitrificans]
MKVFVDIPNYFWKSDDPDRADVRTTYVSLFAALSRLGCEIVARRSGPIRTPCTGRTPPRVCITPTMPGNPGRAPIASRARPCRTSGTWTHGAIAAGAPWPRIRRCRPGARNTIWRRRTR